MPGCGNGWGNEPIGPGLAGFLPGSGAGMLGEAVGHAEVQVVYQGESVSAP
jgi:hypothetical protein